MSVEFRRLIWAQFWTGVGLAGAFGGLWLAGGWGWVSLNEKVWGAALLIMAVSFSTSLVVERYPPGVHYAGARLLCAAFCRTILPLLAILGWAWYSSHSFTSADGLTVAVGYFVPFAICIYLAIREQAEAGVSETTRVD